jgi:hypothetical protein
MPFRKAIVDREVLAIDETGLFQALDNGRQP